MQMRLLRIYQSQVKLQCQFVLMSADDLASALATTGRNADKIGRVFFAIQNMLNAAANLSKAFWGQARSRELEREPLRKSLGVEDTSPIRQVRMRNHYEHFDERLAEWWKQSTHRNYLDRTIGIRRPAGLASVDLFRMFMPSTGELWFWGEKFDLNAIVAEARRILPLATEESKKPYPGKTRGLIGAIYARRRGEA
jgi:hypothetical protein